MKKDVKISVLIILLILIIVGLLGHLHEATRKFISPLPKGFTRTIVKVVQASPGDPIVDEISRVFKNEGTKTVAKAIMCFYSESKLNTLAYNFNSNGTGDYGPAQVNSVHISKYGEKFMYDWRENIRVAYDLYKKHGFKIWYADGCR